MSHCCMFSRLVQPFNRELQPKLLTFHLLVLAVLADAERKQQEQQIVDASLMILGDCLRQLWGGVLTGL